MKFITTVSLKKYLIRREKLFILLIVLFWGVILFFFLGQMYYDARKDTFSHKAEDAFRNALQDKLQDESFEGYLFISKRKLQPKELPDTVYINDAKGRHAYPLDKEKNSRNITYDSRLRYLHSNYLSSYPIAVDSLYEKWNKYLTKERIYGNFVLQILVADNKGNVTISVFPKVPIDGNLMQCFALTVGYRCEVDIRGFYFSSWRQLIGIKGIGYSLLYWLCIIALYGIIIYLRRKMLTIKRERKELMERIRKVKSKPLSIYQLSENIFFHVEQKKLVVDSKEIPMLPQAVVLLQHLLDAFDYFLKDKEIEILFWSDKSCNTSRTYNVVGRLRKVLEKTSFIKIDRIDKAEMTGYQLVFLKVDESSMKSV